VNITLLQNIIYQGFAAFFFYNLRTLGVIGCREELPILYRNSYQKAGPNRPKVEHQTFPINYKMFFFLGNERSVFRFFSPAICFTQHRVL